MPPLVPRCNLSLACAGLVTTCESRFDVRVSFRPATAAAAADNLDTTLWWVVLSGTGGGAARAAALFWSGREVDPEGEMVGVAGVEPATLSLSS